MELRPDYPVTTERLLLRPVELSDVEAMIRYRSQPDVCRYLPFEPQTAEVLRSRFGAGPPGLGSPGLGERALTAEGQALTLGVVLRESGQLIGDVILFFHSVLHRAGEIGWVFHPEAQGHGYATEAAKALLGMAFDDLGLHRVEARLDPRNSASAALCDRLGMRQEAHFVENELFKGEWSDLLVYAILASEWQAGRRSRSSS